ncbi:zf-HC2 domain-containing protein [Nocardiopsis metallicus]|uniref:Anti-sigma factor RsiW n=1 Tax=Nocardiopsis metallicus TaxID=179819 RepID=A0A840WKP0_9ACTN|nr:zf-HC2 domain-containing protein [Nocardiopsis metallicus]MBB5490668.1 anti-sigma factor RsiW [Nocardiopsis metallicus]
MSHDRCGARIAGAYVLGALDTDDAAAAERHLSRCPLCRAEVRDLAVVSTALEGLPLRELLVSLPFAPDRVEGLARRTVERAEAEARESGRRDDRA